MTKSLDTKFYVYRHIRLDTNTPFYIGKGLKGRAEQKINRNKYWKHIVANCGYTIEIIMENLNETQAFSKEIEFIKLYKNLGYCEANFTNGGEGPTGHIHSVETRQKLSNKLKGKAAWNKGKTGIYSEETLIKISNAGKGRTPPNKGVPHTESTKEKLRQFNLGKKHSEETKQKLKGPRGHYNLEPRSEYHKQQISLGMQEYIYVTPTGNFHSSKAAGLSNNMNQHTILRWCRANKSGFSLIQFKKEAL
jgi:hypothetical protein